MLQRGMAWIARLISVKTGKITGRRNIMRKPTLVVAASVLVAVLTIVFHCPAMGQGTIKIGAVQAIWGVFSECFINVDAGLRDAIEMSNQEGGVNGKKIEYIMEPSHYKVPEQKESLKKSYASIIRRWCLGAAPVSASP
jgi:ABC-type branched-subunit amino acid transport system substrate-binding protein